MAGPEFGNNFRVGSTIRAGSIIRVGSTVWVESTIRVGSNIYAGLGVLDAYDEGPVAWSLRLRTIASRSRVACSDALEEAGHVFDEGRTSRGGGEKRRRCLYATALCMLPIYGNGDAVQ